MASRFSKIGPHAQGSNADVKKWAACAPIVKQMDGTDVLRAAPAGAITIYRKYFGYDTPGNIVQKIDGDGGEIANQVINALGGFKPTYVELYNERHTTPGSDCDPSERYILFEQEAAARFHAHGLKMIGGNFCVGWPRVDAWKRYIDHWHNPINGDPKARVDAIGMHEYWSNNLRSEEYALRHRMLYRAKSSPIPIIITEAGRDRVDGNEQCACGRIPNSCGYRSQPNLGEDGYLAELDQYNAEIAKDSYVLGAVIFGGAPNLGPCESDCCWDSFNTDPLVSRIVQPGCGTPPVCNCPADCNRQECGCLNCPVQCVCPRDCGKQGCTCDNCTLPCVCPRDCGRAGCTCAGCPTPCPDCPHNHIEGCTDCETPTPDGLSPWLLAGGMIALSLVGIIAARRMESSDSGYDSMYVRDVAEIDATAPIPNGWFAVG